MQRERFSHWATRSGTQTKPGAIRGIVGWDVHPNVAIEGMLAFGVKDDNGSETINTVIGPVTAPGFGTVSASDTDSDGGASFGLGANFRFTPHAYVGVDYMRYFKPDGVNVNGLTVGLGYRF